MEKSTIEYIILELEAQAEWFEENGSQWSAEYLRERIKELLNN